MIKSNTLFFEGSESPLSLWLLRMQHSWKTLWRRDGVNPWNDLCLFCVYRWLHGTQMLLKKKKKNHSVHVHCSYHRLHHDEPILYIVYLGKMWKRSWTFLSWDTFKPFQPNQTGNYPISSNPNKEGMGPRNCLLDIQATHPFGLSGRSSFHLVRTAPWINQCGSWCISSWISKSSRPPEDALV